MAKVVCYNIISSSPSYKTYDELEAELKKNIQYFVQSEVDILLPGETKSFFGTDIWEFSKVRIRYLFDLEARKKEEKKNNLEARKKEEKKNNE